MCVTKQKRKRGKNVYTCQNMKMHAWTEDYQDRFLKRTVVAWWFADMQVSYTHFVRRWICLLKILSPWIIHKNILALSVETFPVPLTLGLRTSRTSLSLNALDRNRFGVPDSGSERRCISPAVLGIKHLAGSCASYFLTTKPPWCDAWEPTNL